MATTDRQHDEELSRQKNRLSDNHNADTRLYDDMLSDGGAAYDALKTQARIDRALLKLAGGPARSSATLKAREMSALRNEIGDTERQHERFADNVEYALAGLSRKKDADEVITENMDIARRNAMELNQHKFDAELGLQKQYHELDKSNSVFDQMYKLYTKRLIGKDTFKAMTGIEVKAMPKPHRARKPTLILVGGKKPEEKAGYTIKTTYHPTTGAPTYYLVKTKTAKSMDEKGVGLQDKDGEVKNEQRLYLDLNVDGYMDADAAKQFELLQNKDNRDGFVNEFGEGAYWAQLYGSVSRMYSPFSGIKGLDDVDKLIEFADNAKEYIDKQGEEQFYQVFSGLIDAAFVNLTEAINYEKQGGISLDLVRSIPAARDIELYYDENSLQDQIHLAKNEAPERMNYPALLGSLRMPSYYEMPTEITNESLLKVLQDYWGFNKPDSWLDNKHPLSQLHDTGEEKTSEQKADEVVSSLDVYQYDADAKDTAQNKAVEHVRQNGLETVDGDVTQIKIITVGVIGTWDGRTGLLNDDYDNPYVQGPYALTQGELNTLISEQMLKKANGQSMDEIVRTILHANGLDDIANFIDSREEGAYFALTKDAKNKVWEESYDAFEKARKKAENEEQQQTMQQAAQTDIKFQKLVDSIRSDESKTDLKNNLDLGYQLLMGGTAFSDPDDIIATMGFLEKVRASDDPGLKKLNWETKADLAYISTDKIDTLYYYYAAGKEKKDFTEFNKYWDLIKSDVSESFYQAELTLVDKLAGEEGASGELLAGALSVSNSLKAPAAYLETVWAAITGQEVDTSSSAQLAARASADYAQIATEDLEGVGKFAADLTLSLFQNAPSFILSLAGLPMLGAMYSAFMAAGQDAAQMNMLGVSAGKAFIHATVMGGIEFLTERIPLDTLADIAKGSMKAAKTALGKTLSYIGGMGIQAGTEGIQETLTSVISTFADIALAGDSSQYAIMMRQNMELYGMPADEASAAAMQTLMLAALYEGAVGVGSGGITGTVATVIGNKRASYYHETMSAIDIMMAQPDISNDMRSFLNRMKADVQQSGLNIDKNAAQELQLKIKNALPDTRQMQGRKQSQAQTQSQMPEISITNALDTLESHGVDVNKANSAFFDYLTSNESGRTQAHDNAIAALNSTIDAAMSKQQAKGADVSALKALKAQVEADKGGYIQSRYDAKQSQATQAKQDAAVGDAISMLLALPNDVKAKTGVEEAFRAVYDYLTSKEEGKAATYEKAVDSLNGSVHAVIGMNTLDTATVQKLQGLMEEIDSKGSVGDNGVGNYEDTLTLSARFLSRMDPLWENAINIKPIEGYQDIICHGDTISIVYRDTNKNEYNVPALEFAEILKNSPVYEGRPIRLIACEAGAEGSIVAQTVADYLGVEVMAPTDIVHVYPDGEIVIGPDALHNTGTWRVY